MHGIEDYKIAMVFCLMPWEKTDSKKKTWLKHDSHCFLFAL